MARIKDESLYIAWERFKRLLKRCPMHGIDLKTQMDIVYHALNDTSKGIIDASCCGAFKIKSAEEARDLIEDLAKCNMKAPSQFTRGNSRGKGVMELSKMTAMEEKLDAIMHRMNKHERKMHTAHEIGVVEREAMRRNAEIPKEEDAYEVEETKYLNEPRSYHFKPNPNLSTHYNPALRNHENFSYGGGALQGPRNGQNPQQGYQQPPSFHQQHQGSEGRNDYQGHRRTQPFEEQMLQFMRDNKRLIHFYEQKLSDLEAFKSDTQVFQKNISASLKNLETQVGQLALSMPNQSKGTFPSDTQKNPNDCMADQLRSGKEVGNNSKKEKKDETDAEQEESGKEGEKSIQTEQPE